MKFSSGYYQTEEGKTSGSADTIILELSKNSTNNHKEMNEYRGSFTAGDNLIVATSNYY